MAAAAVNSNDLAKAMDDIQGLILFGYRDLTAARFLLLQITDAPAARGWLAGIANRVQTAAVEAQGQAVNIAFTADGLKALGMDERVVQEFALEFVEGMRTEHRQRILGDFHENAPDKWLWGGPANKPVHAALMLYASDEQRLRELVDELTAGFKSGGVCQVQELPAVRLRYNKEHFGFRDGISNPVLKGSPQAAKKLEEIAQGGPDPKGLPTDFNLVEPGEFILGYRNEYGEETARSSIQDLLKNGSYMVFRQLEQNVKAFWTYCNEQTKDASGEDNPTERVRLASKMVGRWPSGASFDRHPDSDPLPPPPPADLEFKPDNEFLFASDDLSGERCPAASHIRRTFPRDTLTIDPLAPCPAAHKRLEEIKESIKVAKRHRILRRGREYGEPLDPDMRPEQILTNPDTGADRGLYFICFNANLGRQFEFVQQTWCNNPKFNGLYSDPDPISRGAIEDDAAKLSDWTFSIPGKPVRQRVTGLPRFVTVRGGAYFFMPGLAALRQMALGNVEGP
jgi:Dyp-type peroxidase family